MDAWLQLAMTMINGLPSIIFHPFTYVLLFVILLMWKRQVDFERKLFGTRLNTVGEGFVLTVFHGIIAGLLLSLILIGIGVVFSLEPFLYLWCIAVILMMFHVRYLCFAYAGAILGVLSLIARTIPANEGLGAFAYLWTSIANIYLPSVFAIVAVLHLAEAFLVKVSKGRYSTPVFIQSKRGRLVGAYNIQYIWFVPIFFLIDGFAFDGSQGVTLALYNGWPLVSGNGFGVAPLSLLLLPAVLGYSEQAVSSTPVQKTQSSYKWLLAFSLILLALTMGALLFSPLIVAAIIFSFVGHDVMIKYSHYQEMKRPPIYVHPNKGLKILTIIPESPAEKMGLQSGEIIMKVNGQETNKRMDLYMALSLNKAYCRLEVLNLEGHVKFVNRSIYEDEHHQLGVILAPDEAVPYYVEQQEMNLFRLIRQRFRRKNNADYEPTHLDTSVNETEKQA